VWILAMKKVERPGVRIGDWNENKHGEGRVG
jgi:hypothetical protein